MRKSIPFSIFFRKTRAILNDTRLFYWIDQKQKIMMLKIIFITKLITPK